MHKPNRLFLGLSFTKLCLTNNICTISMDFKISGSSTLKIYTFYNKYSDLRQFLETLFSFLDIFKTVVCKILQFLVFVAWPV